MRREEGLIWSARCHQITISAGSGVPRCGRIFYPAQAQWAEGTIEGWVQIARLDRTGCRVRGLAFPAEDTISSLIAHLDIFPAGNSDWQIEHEHAASLVRILPPPGVCEQLAGAIKEDYRAHLSAVVAQIAQGDVPADYARVWYFLLCQEAGIDPREEPTPQELVEALRLCDMAAPTEAKVEASFRRGLARMQRRREAWAQHQAWRDAHLLGLVPTSIFPASVLRLADLSSSQSFGSGPGRHGARLSGDLGGAMAGLCLAHHRPGLVSGTLVSRAQPRHFSDDALPPLTARGRARGACGLLALRRAA